MNREEIAREMLVMARELMAAPSFNPGDYIMQPHHESPIYGRVIEEQKNGGYKAVLIGGWSGRRPAIKSTKGAHPDFQLIKESEVPAKFKAGIAKKFPRVAASKMKVNDLVEIIGGNPKFKGQKAEITGIVGSVAPYQFTVVLKNGKKLVYRGDELKLVRSQMRRKFSGRGVDNTHILRDLRMSVDDAMDLMYREPEDIIDHADTMAKELRHVEDLLNDWARGGVSMRELRELKMDIANLKDYGEEAEADEWVDEDEVRDRVKEIQKSFKKLEREMQSMRAI